MPAAVRIYPHRTELLSAPRNGDSASRQAAPRRAYPGRFRASDRLRPDRKSTRKRCIYTFSWLRRRTVTACRPPSASRPDPTSSSRTRRAGYGNRYNRRVPKRRPSATVSVPVIGLPALDSATITSLPSGCCASHVQPEPNNPTAAFVKASRKASTEPKSRASAASFRASAAGRASA